MRHMHAESLQLRVVKTMPVNVPDAVGGAIAEGYLACNDDEQQDRVHRACPLPSRAHFPYSCERNRVVHVLGEYSSYT